MGEYDQKLNICAEIHTLMFVVVVIFILFSIFGQIHQFFGQVQRLMFVVVKFWSSSNVKVCCCQFFQSNSNQFLVILIRSSKLATRICLLHLSKKVYARCIPVRINMYLDFLIGNGLNHLSGYLNE